MGDTGKRGNRGLVGDAVAEGEGGGGERSARRLSL